MENISYKPQKDYISIMQGEEEIGKINIEFDEDKVEAVPSFFVFDLQTSKYINKYPSTSLNQAKAIAELHYGRLMS